MVYGFTSDLPPIDETIRVEDENAARRLEAQRQQNGRPGRVGPQRSRTQQAPGVVPAAGVAPGTAPTPTPPAAGGAPIGGAGLLGGALGFYHFTVKSVTSGFHDLLAMEVATAGHADVVKSEMLMIKLYVNSILTTFII